MSDIKWCDIGGHPFSTNDTRAVTYTSSKRDENGDVQRIDVCSPCIDSGKFTTVSLTDVTQTRAVEAE